MAGKIDPKTKAEILKWVSDALDNETCRIDVLNGAVRYDGGQTYYEYKATPTSGRSVTISINGGGGMFYV